MTVFVEYVSFIGPEVSERVDTSDQGDVSGGAALGESTLGVFRPILQGLQALAAHVGARFVGAPVHAAEFDAMRPDFEALLTRHAKLEVY